VKGKVSPKKRRSVSERKKKKGGDRFDHRGKKKPTATFLAGGKKGRVFPEKAARRKAT